MAGLPVLTYFPGTKTGNEVWIYYNLGNAVLQKKNSSAGEILLPNCSGNEDCPAGSWTASILTTPNGAAAVGSIPAFSPIYSATAGDVSPSEDGVGVDVVCLPDWDTNVLLCYDDSFDETPGNPFRAIPRKFQQADHYVKQRVDSSIRIDDKYVSNWDGLRAISGRRVTLIAVVIPQDGAAISEVIYYTNVLIVPPAMTYGSDQNGTIVLSGTGSYSIKAIFSALKP